MRFRLALNQATSLLLCSMMISCGRSSSKGTGHDDEPAAAVDETSARDDDDNTPPEDEYVENTKINQTFAEFDPRTYVPAQDYETKRYYKAVRSDRLIYKPIPLPGTSIFPDCKNKLVMESRSQLTPTIDGKDKEWNLRQLVSLDRAGDGVVLDDTTVDMREAYYAEDEEQVYIALRVDGKWPSAADSRTPI